MMFCHYFRRKNTIPSSISIVPAAKIALFPTLVPELYSYSKQFSPETPFLSELVCSPSLLLLPPSWRVQVVLQIATEALLHIGEGSRWRKKLPPTWTLNVFGNVWLLWAFLFKSQAFPKAYEKVILSVCRIFILFALCLKHRALAFDTFCSQRHVQIGARRDST